MVVVYAQTRQTSIFGSICSTKQKGLAPNLEKNEHCTRPGRVARLTLSHFADSWKVKKPDFKAVRHSEKTIKSRHHETARLSR
jgi:hypothetical protein